MKDIKYPVDSANFTWIRQKGFVYVDKTAYIHRMVGKGKYYFLARPRRFGKSLFLDTLAEYFMGNRELFQGLAIERLQPGEWEEHPVLRFNLSKKNYVDRDSLKEYLNILLTNFEYDFKIENDTESPETRFYYLIEKIHKNTGKRVVVLIDENDAPLYSTDNPELRELYRTQLESFYTILKAAEEHLQFSFLTGEGRYGRPSEFGGFNNIQDITFNNEYAGICGITKEELTQYYDEGIGEFAEKKGITKEEAYGLLKFHYDGYHFSGCLLDIYNPFSINNALYDREIKDYWCKSGVPTLLSKTLLENDYDIQDLCDNVVDEATLADLSIYSTEPLPLFYQTGYLTLKSFDAEDQLFTVGYPNREVEKGILNNVLSVYNPGARGITPIIAKMKRSLREGKPNEFMDILKAFMADIPSKLHTRVDRYENYYHTIFYCLVKLIGLDIDAEYNTSKGFIDILIKTDKYIYVIELKVNGTAEEALRQIKEKHYCTPFEADPRQLYKIGIGFSTESHRIEGSKIEL